MMRLCDTFLNPTRDDMFLANHKTRNRNSVGVTQRKIKENIMANTYSKIYIHVVFRVGDKFIIINKAHKEKIHKYINGIIKAQHQKLIAINSIHDHIHLLIGIKPKIALSDLMRIVKNNSSKFINQNKWMKGKFKWQEGFGAFSIGHSQLDKVINYIQNQEKHHKKKSFKEEYLLLLKKYEIDYDDRYVFDWISASD